jgi:anti-anti-sigma factor
MGSSLDVSIRTERGAMVLAVGGELDLASFATLEQAIDSVSDANPELVVLDLGELEFMDVTGLRAVLRSDQRLRERGKRLALAGPTAGVRRLLTLTGHDGVLSVFESTATALSSA